MRMSLVTACRRCYSVMELGSSPAAAAVTSVARPAERRALYRRSNTLSALPLDDLHSVSSSSGAECRRPLAPIADSPVQEDAAELTPGDERIRPSTAVPRQGRTSDVSGGRRAQFYRKASCNDLLLSDSSGAVRSLYSPSASSGLVASTSGGRLLTKVKERIRDTVLQTTSEWPAVVQERRQRAAIQFEMRAARMLVDEQRPAAEAATVAGDKAGSCNAPVDDRKEAARAAFRRHRSVSCEDAVASMIGGKLHPESAAAATGKTGRSEQRESSSSNDISGIICSSKDLQSIIELSRRDAVGDESSTSRVSVTSTDNVRNVAAVDASVVLPFKKPTEESSPGKRRRLTKDKTSDVYVECPDAAAATLVAAKPLNDDGDLSPRKSGSDRVPVTSSSHPESATAGEVVSADGTARPMTKPSDVVYDTDGRTWDVYGAQLDPEVLGDAIQRHLQSIMLTASSITAMTSRVAAVVETPTEDRKDDGDLSAAVAAKQQPERSDDDCRTERRRNFIKKCLPKRRR